MNVPSTISRCVARGYVLLAISAILGSCSAGAGDGDQATEATFDSTEYAVRWVLAAHPDKTASWVRVTLFPTVPADKVEQENFEVQYFNWIDRPPPSVAGAKEILRTRKKTKGDKTEYELTYKLRAPVTFSVGESPCLLPSAPDREAKSKREVDASLSDKKTFHNAYSFSCSWEKAAAPLELPASIAVERQNCSTLVSRLELKIGKGRKVKLETWQLNDGAVIEVSTSDLTESEFLARIGTPLIEAGIKPMVEGKTHLAGQCPAT